MKTFTSPKKLAENPYYKIQRRRILAGIRENRIDKPIIDLIHAFHKMPCCFTLQCCYGHFVYNGHKNPHNLDPLPVTNEITHIEYRIAYIAFCAENSDSGKELLERLQDIPAIDPHNIQFGSAEWFWKRQVNSYVLQVEPERFKGQDRARLDYREAVQIEKTRDAFFIHLRNIFLL
ncbi:hypothetical protein JW935_00775 [candidate division KSB1 bacterium]|nr:hypothetical protein [candidate division KSB1 bacterium]